MSSMLLHDWLRSEVFLLSVTLGAFLLGLFLYRKSGLSLLQPLLISMVLLIPFLKLTGIDYPTYYEKTRLLHFLLGPCVVALGYVLYEQSAQLKGRVLPILTSVVVGSFVGIASVVFLARVFGADRMVVASLAPKSVTTPIAMSLSATHGGIPSLTAAFVVLCGLFGGLVGPWVLRLLGIRSEVAKGLAMGSASHALGTVRALEMGALEGAVSGLAIGLMGIATALLIPLMENFL